MDEKIYSITLTDGTVIENLRLNGDNFISKSPLTEETFMDNCYGVIINDGERNEVHENMEFVQIKRFGDEYWLVLRDISSDELSQMKLRADIEYIAMMSGVEL